MRDGDKRMDAYLNNNKSKSDNDKSCPSVANSIGNRAKLFWIIAIEIALILSAGPAFGQFTVQPMKLELQVTPGKIVNSTLRVQSFDPDETHTINMTTTELSQLDNASWDIIEPNDITDPNSPHFGFDMSKLSSCKDWISFSHNTFQLEPGQAFPLEVSMRVERGVRGFYGAGILATTSEMQGVGNVSVVVRFYVPVLIEIQDKPVRANVAYLPRPIPARSRTCWRLNNCLIATCRMTFFAIFLISFSKLKIKKRPQERTFLIFLFFRSRRFSDCVWTISPYWRETTAIMTTL